METSREADPASLPGGTEVGPWRVVSRGSRGTYGVIYRVERVGQAGAGLFALKLAVHPLDPRFEREAELLSRLRHPHVPRLHDRGWWMGPGGVPFPYLVLDWVEGIPLYEWASQHPLTSRQALRLLAQVARALQATHEVEGVHRDVKGGNVLVREEDARAMLVDFGSGDFRGARTLTRQLMPPGTPQYWSPEALRFQWSRWRERAAHYEAGPADDVYALGVTAYRLVTGMYPPSAPDLEVGEGAPPLTFPALVPPEVLVSLSPELAALIRQMLAEEPSARGSAGEVAQALERAAETAGREADQPITRIQGQVPTEPPAQPVEPGSALARRRWLTAAAVGVAMAVSLWGAARRQPEERPAEVAREASDGGVEDGGTSGLADAALMARVGVEMREPVRGGLGLDMPKKPFPGQRRPPCRKPEVEINGGCWAALRDATPPCGDNSYEWKNGCYWPSFVPPRPATSEEP